MLRFFQLTSRITFSGVLFGLALVLGGCAQQGSHTGIRGFGDSVLSTVGYTPEPTKFDAAKPASEASSFATPEQEYYLGRGVAAHVLLKYDLLHNPKLIQYLNQVLQAVVAQSDLPNTFGGYHVTVLDTDDVTAVSAPGGIIFLSRGILKLIKDEDTLAAVLAHEVTHVTEHHGVRSIPKDAFDQAVKNSPIPLTGLSCDEVLLMCCAVFGVVVEDITNDLLDKGYDREYEFDADKGAVKILRKAGYNPAAIILILGALQEVKNRASGGWFSTHPSPEIRIEEADKELVSQSIDPFFKAGIKKRNHRFTLALRSL